MGGTRLAKKATFREFHDCFGEARHWVIAKAPEWVASANQDFFMILLCKL